MTTIATIPLTVIHTPVNEPATPDRVLIEFGQHLADDVPVYAYWHGRFGVVVSPEVAEQISKGQSVRMIVTTGEDDRLSAIDEAMVERVAAKLYRMCGFDLYGRDLGPFEGLAALGEKHRWMARSRATLTVALEQAGDAFAEEIAWQEQHMPGADPEGGA